jgi:hypothetical protein
MDQGRPRISRMVKIYTPSAFKVEPGRTEIVHVDADGNTHDLEALALTNLGDLSAVWRVEAVEWLS